jgi:hypothetical protein
MEENEEYRERPVWRTVLSIVLAIIAVVRLFATCNQTNSNQNKILDASQFNTSEQQFLDQKPLTSTLAPNIWNDLLYKRYKYLDSLDQTRLKDFYITKLAKDSLVSLDIKSQLKIEKGCFFQNTQDDTLKFAFKTPKNINVFVHDFESNASADKSFKKLKAGSGIKNFKEFIKLSPTTKLVTYNIEKQKIKFNGIAYVFEQNNYLMFVELESSTWSQKKLNREALTYVANHIKVSK